VVWVESQRSAAGPDGRRCAADVSVPVAAWVQPAPAATPERYLAAYLASLGPCPGADPVPAQSPVSPAAAMADRFFQEVPLPTPDPVIAPGRAITGLTAYLQTRGATTHAFTRSTPLGPMAIDATGTYTVDWGDGTVTGPHSVEGRPWPEGQITHSYTDVGTYDVVVTETWTAAWRVGSERGTLGGLRTTARIEAFPVGEVQAVGVPNPPVVRNAAGGR